MPVKDQTAVDTTPVRSRRSLPVINDEMIERLGQKKEPELERTLVDLARNGGLAGVVSKPARYSATTIQWYSDCQRKFYWPTLAGLPDPPSTAQELGTELHKHQEIYLKTGKLPPNNTFAGMLANKGLVHLPQAKSKGLFVEADFEVQLPGVPVVVTGQIDFTKDPSDAAAKSFLLGDHKTARSKRWPKDAKWLATNIQSNLYTKVRADELKKIFKSLRAVEKKWVYYYKDERIVEPLHITQSLDDVEEQYGTIIQPALIGMARMVREAPKVTDVPAADRSVCEMYRGCPHQTRCFGMGANASKSTFSKAGIVAKLETKGESNMGAVAVKFSKQAIAAKVQGAGSTINPPKPKIGIKAAPKAPPPEIEEEIEETEVGGGETEAEVEEEVVEEEEEVLAPAPVKAKPKAAIQAKPAPVVVEEEEEAPTPRKAGKAGRTTPGANPQHNFWLFVGCRPTRGFEAEAVDFETVIGAAQADGANRNGKDHYRDGASYGLLEACFAYWLEVNPLVGAIVVTDPTTLAARDVVGLLRAHASVVVE